MNITDIKTFVMWAEGAGRNWMFVKVETDEGIHGWGEGTLVNQVTTIAEAVHMLAPQIVGQSAFDIERHWQTMYLHNRYRNGVIINSALSAIDQALWDIKGKALGVPVYQLLGGAVRNHIRTYTGADTVEVAKTAVEQGFTAIKSGWGYSMIDLDERTEPGKFKEHIAMMRDAVGPDIDVMVDNHGRSRPAMAIKLIRSIEEYNLLFFEEPVPPNNIDSLALVRQAGLGTELATGERLLTRWGNKDVIERQLVDVLQPDVCHCGGISELRRIAAMAETYYINMAFHNPKGPVATAASIHVAASIPNFLILEHVSRIPVFDEIQVEPMGLGEGYYELPTAPGLGVDLNEEVFESYPYRYRPVLFASHEDGAPAHP